MKQKNRFGTIEFNSQEVRLEDKIFNIKDLRVTAKLDGWGEIKYIGKSENILNKCYV